MSENKKDNLESMGIRSDRIMTPLEEQIAAANYNSVKRASEAEPNLFTWLVLGFCALIVILGVIDTLCRM